MKVLHLNTNDTQGGAARAAFRLHTGLRHLGGDSKMLVQARAGDDPDVLGPPTRAGRVLALFRPTLDALPLSLYRGRKKNPFSTAMMPGCIGGGVRALNPDIINLHWVCAGFLRIETLAKFRRPIVWTLHDMWPFTGGCHYDDECGRYVKTCGRCPLLGSDKERDISRRIWRRKKKAWQGLDITIVTPSRWLARRAEGSSLFKDSRVEVIPNGLDTSVFKPADRVFTRERFGLPVDKKLILFGAMSATSDKRKGFQLLAPALKCFSKDGFGEEVELVILGSSRPESPADFGLKAHYMGQLNDDVSLALLYAATDVFVAPSIQDNLPNTVMEALACGTPVVAFDVGGIPDMVEHKKNGYIAKSFDTGDLARGIKWVLEDRERRARLGASAREKVEQEYSSRLQAERYIALYEDVLKR